MKRTSSVVMLLLALLLGAARAEDALSPDRFARYTDYDPAVPIYVMPTEHVIFGSGVI